MDSVLKAILLSPDGSRRLGFDASHRC